jgi:hypothetical protein
MSDSELIAAISNRFGFALPADYLRLQATGMMTLGNPAHRSVFLKPGSYLWLNDMEWYSLKDLAAFEFNDDQMPGFVPFAFTGAGDYWCWQVAFTNERGTRVVCCWHDDGFATIYAPDFAAALYRQALAFCRECVPDEVDLAESRAFLNRWSLDLACIFPRRWCQRLADLATAQPSVEPSIIAGKFDRVLLTAKQLSSIEHEDVAYDQLGQSVQWMV